MTKMLEIEAAALTAVGGAVVRMSDVDVWNKWVMGRVEHD